MIRSGDFWTVLLAAVIFAAIAMWSTPGFPATARRDSPIATADVSTAWMRH
jgi:hypothetical protein